MSGTAVIIFVSFIAQSFADPCCVTHYKDVAGAAENCQTLIIKDIEIPAKTTLKIALQDGANLVFDGHLTHQVAEWTGDLVQVTGNNVEITGTDDHLLDGLGPKHWKGDSEMKILRPKFMRFHVYNSLIRNLKLKNCPNNCFLLSGADNLVRNVHIDNHDGYPSAYGIQIFYLFFSSFYDAYSECIIIFVLAYPIVRLKMLQHAFLHFDTYQLKSTQEEGPESGSVRFMKSCIRTHTSIIRYVTEFNRVMSTCMFLDFSQSAIHMACVLVETVMGPAITVFKLFSVALYLLVLNVRLSLYYYHANEVIVMSEGLSGAIYQSSWYEEPLTVRHMMGITISRAQRPLSYKLGPFGPMSLQVYLSIVKAAYSYVMLVTRQTN